MKRVLITLSIVIASVFAVVGGVAVVSLSRSPVTPPVSTNIPDGAFLVPGVESFVVWEARRDARRAIREDQGLLLGYLHFHNVGILGKSIR